MSSYTIGIDIGGTHTDGVLVDTNGSLLSSYKITTTAPIAEGVKNLLSELSISLKGSFDSVKAINISTTHPTNALLERRNLSHVGVIRIAGGEPVLSPCAGWPDQLRKAINPVVVTIPGGYECDGRVSAHFSLATARHAIEKLLAHHVEAIAIVGVFSPLFSDQEESVRQLVLEYSATIPVSCSYEIGGIGFSDRENGAILNAALIPLLASDMRLIGQVAKELEIYLPIRISQNDGTLADTITAQKFPIRMAGAGPLNSARGGARCVGFSECVVVDIGGTSTDVMSLYNGVPAKSYKNSSIGGVSLSLKMVDLVSIALGGGSLVTQNEIGPTSVARSLLTDSQIFGGAFCTLTDVASRAGFITLPHAKTDTVFMSSQEAKRIMCKATEMIESVARRMRGTREIPMVLVGGGAALFDASLFSLPAIIPQNAGVASALGAAYGQIGATIDRVVCLSDREKVLEILRGEAFSQAEFAGADPTAITIIDEQIIPYDSYLGNRARVSITAAGPLKNR
jgi:N-methylhydantoinase A/oxoprolinase/acetone carboxylase beta subunit